MNRCYSWSSGNWPRNERSVKRKGHRSICSRKNANITHTICQVLPGTKKRTILEIRGEKNAVPCVISCSIRRDQRRAKVADRRGSDLPSADRAWPSMIAHVEQRSSRRESRWWFFFLSRVVVAHRMSFFSSVLTVLPFMERAKESYHEGSSLHNSHRCVMCKTYLFASSPLYVRTKNTEIGLGALVWRP